MNRTSFLSLSILEKCLRILIYHTTDIHTDMILVLINLPLTLKDHYLIIINAYFESEGWNELALFINPGRHRFAPPKWRWGR